MWTFGCKQDLQVKTNHVTNAKQLANVHGLEMSERIDFGNFSELGGERHDNVSHQ